jgi:hypothetical protein
MGERRGGGVRVISGANRHLVAQCGCGRGGVAQMGGRGGEAHAAGGQVSDHLAGTGVV